MLDSGLFWDWDYSHRHRQSFSSSQQPVKTTMPQVPKRAWVVAPAPTTSRAIADDAVPADDAVDFVAPPLAAASASDSPASASASASTKTVKHRTAWKAAKFLTRALSEAQQPQQLQQPQHPLSAPSLTRRLTRAPEAQQPQQPQQPQHPFSAPSLTRRLTRKILATVRLGKMVSAPPLAIPPRRRTGITGRISDDDLRTLGIPTGSDEDSAVMASGDYAANGSFTLVGTPKHLQTRLRWIREGRDGSCSSVATLSDSSSEGDRIGDTWSKSECAGYARCISGSHVRTNRSFGVGSSSFLTGLKSTAHTFQNAFKSWAPKIRHSGSSTSQASSDPKASDSPPMRSTVVNSHDLVVVRWRRSRFLCWRRARCPSCMEDETAPRNQDVM